MKAILLSAGYGKRLKPITNNTPKCLIKIKNKPIINHWIEKLMKCNIKKILINTHYLSYKVIQELNKSPYRSKIVVTNERKLLGTAGTLLKNKKFLDDEILLAHCDNFFFESLNKYINSHKKRHKKHTMSVMVFKTKSPSKCGIFELNKGKIVGFHEKKKNNKGNLANSAIYILSREIIRDLIKSKRDISDFSKDVIPNNLNQMHLYKTNKQLFDIGDVRTLFKVNQL